MVRTALLVSLVLGPVVWGTAAETEPTPLLLPEAAARYLRDPATGAAGLLDVTRGQRSDTLGIVYTLLVCDAAIRVGRLDLASALASDLRLHVTDPGTSGIAEMILAWVAVARSRGGEAIAHLETAGTVAPALSSMSGPAAALLRVMRGDPDAIVQFNAHIAQRGVDAAWREVAPLLEAYVQYWSGDALGASRAFTAFAVAHPDSRFADDALYAAAETARRAGLEHEAWKDLELLAGDEPRPRGVSRRLLTLDGRALLAEGIRLDRIRGPRTLPRRFVDLLDGDGVRLAGAALGRRRKHRQDDTAPAGSSALETRPHQRRDLDASVSSPPTAPSPSPQAARASPTGGGPGTWRAGWLVLALVVAVLLLVAGRRRSQASARST